MTGHVPKRPSGSSPQAIFMQWIWDQLTGGAHLNQVQGARYSSTTRGNFIIPITSAGSSVQVKTLKLRLVEDDYLICRTWNGEDGVDEVIGTSDIFVAKQIQHHTVNATSSGHYGLNGAQTAVRLDHVYTFGPDTHEPYLVFEPENPWGEVAEDFAEGGEMFQRRLNKIRTVTVTVPESAEGEGDGAVYTEDQRILPVWLRGDAIHAISANTGVVIPETEEDPEITVSLLHIAEARQWARIN